MTNHEDRDVLPLGNLHQLGGDRPDLGDRPNRRGHVGRLHRLNRVNDYKLGLNGINRRPDGFHVGFRVDIKVLAGNV